MRLSFCLAASTLLFAIVSVSNAHADTASFTVSGSGISGSGTLTLVPSTTSSVSDAEDVTAITGTFSSQTSSAQFSGPIVGLVLPVSYSDTNPTLNAFIVYDDLYYPNSDAPVCFGQPPGTTLDFCGIAFFVKDTSTSTQHEVALFGGPDGFLEIDDNGSTFGNLNVPVNFAVVTPEPSSVALFATGLLSCAAFIRRRLA